MATLRHSLLLTLGMSVVLVGVAVAIGGGMRSIHRAAVALRGNFTLSPRDSCKLDRLRDTSHAIYA